MHKEMKPITQLVDLGFAVARVQLSEDSLRYDGEHALSMEIFSPQEEGTQAQSVYIWQYEGIVALRDVLDDMIAKRQAAVAAIPQDA